MKYLLAIIIPPVALLWIGRPMHFVINAVLWMISIPLTLMFFVFAALWLACIIHALVVCFEEHKSPLEEDEEEEQQHDGAPHPA